MHKTSNLLFHIGRSKTGSTSLQDGFMVNRAAFLNKDILYPQISGHSNHRLLLFADAPDTFISEHTGRFKPARIVGVRSRAQAAWENLEREIDQTRAVTVVLSTEVAFTLDPDHLQRLMHRLRKIAAHIQIIGYLREPSSFYLSKIQQSVKYGPDISNPYIPLDHKGPLDAWGRIGADTVQFLPFRRDAFKNGCIFDDFLARFLGLSEHADLDRTSLNRNVSISAEGMELIRSFNVARSKTRRVAGDPVCKAVLGAIEAFDANEAPVRPKLHVDVAAAIQHANQDDLDWLWTNWNIDFRDPASLADALPPQLFTGPRQDLRTFIALDEDRLHRLRNSCWDRLLQQAQALDADRTQPVIDAHPERPGPADYNDVLALIVGIILRHNKLNARS